MIAPPRGRGDDVRPVAGLDDVATGPAEDDVVAVEAVDGIDPATTLQGYAHAGTAKSFLQDRSGLNKAYWTLKMNGGGAALGVVNGTEWSSDTTYRWAVVTDSDALCAR